MIEIAMFENNIVIYKFIQDLHFYVTGGNNDNELFLASVLLGFCDAFSQILRTNVDKNEALVNLDLILLRTDEIVDRGMILETDTTTIAGKVASHHIDAGAPLSEQTLAQALGDGKGAHYKIPPNIKFLVFLVLQDKTFCPVF